MIDKATGYKHRLYCVEYDLLGMIQAYGPECMHWLIEEVMAGNIKADRDVQRWAAHKHLYKYESTNNVPAPEHKLRPAKAAKKAKIAPIPDYFGVK